MRTFCLLVIASTVLLSACGKTEPSETITAPDLDSKTEVVSEDPTEEATPIDVSDMEFDLGGFNPTDTSTWGEVVETDQAGNPTAYVRTLPNGNTQSLIFHHGWDNEKFVKSDNIPGAQYIHWHRPDPSVPIILQDRTTSEWTSIVQKYARAWSKSPVLNIRVVQAQDRVTNRRMSIMKCRIHTLGVITACNYDFRDNRAMKDSYGGYAVTINAPDGHIESAVVHFNDYHKRTNENHPDHASDTEGSIAHATANRNFLVCHELGHALGLKHFDNTHNSVSLGTCMDYSSDPWQSLMPDAHDFEELLINYSHSHTQTKASGTVCTLTEASKITRTYIVPIRFNGVSSIAQKQETEYPNNNRQMRSHQIMIATEDDRVITYNWHVPDKTKMRAHSRGKTGEFPYLVSNTITAFETSGAEELYLGLKRQSEILPTVNEQQPEGYRCNQLSNEQLRDIDRFTPPLNGSKTGSYEVNKIQKSTDGTLATEDANFVIRDDYESTYEYAETPMVTALIDPDIKPQD